jgi:hypothetical protein
MDDLTGKPLLRSMIGPRIWALFDTDPAAFKREVVAYFARGYPGWTVVKVVEPIIYLRDDRNPKNK